MTTETVDSAFLEAWAKKEAEGYRYGQDALEQVRFGWDMAMAHVAAPRKKPGAPVDSDDPTEEELCWLSCFVPNLACVIEREPPKMVEETRREARQELVAILREMRTMRSASRVKDLEDFVELVARMGAYNATTPFIRDRARELLSRIRNGVSDG